MLPTPSSSASHKVTTPRIWDGEDWSRRTSRADHATRHLPRHARNELLTWENLGNAAAGHRPEHDGTATTGCLDVPKVTATTKKSVTKLFASAVQRPLASVN